MHFLQIRYQNGDFEEQYVLKLDKSALFNVSAFPVEDGVTGAALLKALEERGAVLNDYEGEEGVIPAQQIFDLRQGGGRKWLSYCTDGKFKDPSPGVPAIQSFNPENGDLVAATSYDGGKKVHAYTGAELAEWNIAGEDWLHLPTYLQKYDITGPT